MVQPWLPATPALTPEQVAAVVAAYPMVVIHAWGVWNHYDRTMDTRLQAARERLGKRIAFFSYDVDPPPAAELLRQWDVLNLPALICYVRGQHHETRMGLRTEPDLMDLLETWARAAEPEL